MEDELASDSNGDDVDLNGVENDSDPLGKPLPITGCSSGIFSG